MSPRRLLLSFLLLFSCLSGGAQKFSTKFFNSKDGLPQSQVLSIAEDKLGYLWVGTYGGGLARFDGKHFSVYTEEDGMRDNYVHKVYVDSRNNIWAGTAKGLSKFDGKKFTSYKGLTDVVTQMTEFNDTLFAVSREFKLSKIVNDSIYCVDCAIGGMEKIQFLASGTADSFYFMQDSVFLHRRDRLGDQMIDVSALEKIYNIFPAGDSVTIISAKGAYQWSKQNLRLVDARINTPLILADENLTTLWSTTGAGVVKTTSNSSGFFKETIKIDAMATDAFNDAEGNTWIGTSGNGLMKYFVKDFEFLGNPITVSVLKSNGKLWVATRFQGVNIYSEDNRLKKNIPMESLGRRLKALREDMDGSIWVAAASDIARIDKDTYHVNRFTSQNGLKNATINNIETEPSQKLWVSYRGQGLQFWDGKKFEDFSMNHQLSSMDVLGMKYIPYGDRLMVCTSNGVDEVRHGKVSRLKIPEFYKTPVLCAAPYKTKYVIFGTDGKGLCLYNLDNSSVTYYSKKHGLKSGLIFFVSADEKGYVWIGSNVGVEKIKFNEKLEIEEHYYFSDANGLNGLETNVNASFISGDDKYFGLIDGLYHFSTTAVNPPVDFELHFTNVELLNSSYSLSAYATDRYGFYKVPLNPQLPHDKNSIKFSFSKVSKKYPESTEYKFILEGLEKEWSMLAVEEEVSYKDLPPGQYTFKVMASDFSGKWTNPYLEYPFSIAAPFYKTTLFLASSFLLLVLLIVLLVYYRVRRTMLHALALEEVKAKEIIRLRKEIGRDFHDELGNQLARIVNYISLIKMNRGENMEMLTMVEESAKNLIGGTRDFIWALDHENDSLSNLFVNLKDFGDRLFSEKNIEFRAFHSIRHDTKLPMGYTRQINLIVKESMTNCFKHANATRVDLDFKELLSDLRISLKDNGIGIAAEKEFSNGGISNIRHRAERINSQFEIISNGQGTEITLQLNFKP